MRVTLELELWRSEIEWIVEDLKKYSEVFERIAKAGKTVEDIHPHEAYEGEIEERFKKMRRWDTLMQTSSFMQPYMKVKKVIRPENW